MSNYRRIVKVLTALLVALSLTIMPRTTTTAQAADADPCYLLNAIHSAHALAVENASQADGARVVQVFWEWGQRPLHERFKFIPVSGKSNTYYIQAMHSKKFLEPSGPEVGAAIRQVGVVGAARQQWEQVATADGKYYNKYRNVATDLYLDVEGYSVAFGAPLIQWTKTDGKNQVFFNSPVSCS